MTSQRIDESGRLIRGNAPVSAISVPSSLLVGDLLTHTLDYVIMLHLLHAAAEGRSLTPPLLWQELQARGVRSEENADHPVGRAAVYESLSRLIEAGFIRSTDLTNDHVPLFVEGGGA